MLTILIMLDCAIWYKRYKVNSIFLTPVNRSSFPFQYNLRLFQILLLFCLFLHHYLNLLLEFLKDQLLLPLVLFPNWLGLGFCLNFVNFVLYFLFAWNGLSLHFAWFLSNYFGNFLRGFRSLDRWLIFRIS